MYFNVNFNVFSKNKKLHLLVSKLYSSNKSVWTLDTVKFPSCRCLSRRHGFRLLTLKIKSRPFCGKVRGQMSQVHRSNPVQTLATYFLIFKLIPSSYHQLSPTTCYFSKRFPHQNPVYCTLLLFVKVRLLNSYKW